MATGILAMEPMRGRGPEEGNPRNGPKTIRGKVPIMPVQIDEILPRPYEGAEYAKSVGALGDWQ